MLRSLLDAAYGKLGNQQVSAIFAMRFTHIPELRWTWSYPVAVVLMAAVCVALYRNLRHNRWL